MGRTGVNPLDRTLMDATCPEKELQVAGFKLQVKHTQWDRRFFMRYRVRHEVLEGLF